MLNEEKNNNSDDKESVNDELLNTIRTGGTAQTQKAKEPESTDPKL